MGSRRAGFVLDAKSMGLNTSRPPSPSPPASSTRVPKESQLEKANTSQESSLEATCRSQCNASTESLSTDSFRCLLQKLRNGTGDAGEVNFELNNIFLKRLDEIDCLDGQGGDAMYTSELRLVTFQEWVEFLLHVNNVILGNMSDLEEEAYGKIVACVNSVQGEQQQALDENRKLRRDLCALIKLVQTAHNHNRWDKKHLTLETLTPNQLFGVAEDQTVPESESEKMAECMKSLVNEMAAKHDELLHLKSQIGALDEVILTARQKLLLKDQCIAQLNQQLQEITECFATMSDNTLCQGHSAYANATKDLEGGPLDFEDSPSDTIANELLENLSIQDNQESEMLRLLNSELNELFDLNHKKDYQAMESGRKRLSCFFEKLSTERDDTVKKLECIRSHLRILQTDIDQSCLNTFSSGTTGPGDPDTQMMEALRRRMHSLGQSNRELHGKYQRLDTESKKLQARIESENSFSQRNSDILKEIAEMICKMGTVEFSYNEIYDESSTENPFCIAIMEMFEQRSQQERKQMACNEHLACQIHGLQGNLKDRDNQIDQLQSMIKSYSDFSENNRLKGEIHELKQKNSDLSRQLREISTLLSNQEEQRVELCSKYESLMSSFEDQCQELKGAKRRVQSLQTKLDQVEQLQDELRTERKMLREEVIALKEKEAVSTGRERALYEQQKNGHLELDKLRQMIRELQAQMRMESSQHSKNVQRIEETRDSMRAELHDYRTKNQQMEIRLKQQTEVNRQQDQIIESFRKWRDAQVRADDAVRQCAKQSEEHIHMLLEENQALAEDYRSLFRDHTLLEKEMFRVKQAVNYASSSSMGCPPTRMNPDSGNDMNRRLQNLTSTSQRISNQNRNLNMNSRSRPVAQSTMRQTGSSEDLS
nr:major antigen [Drosophila takahashii]